MTFWRKIKNSFLRVYQRIYRFYFAVTYGLLAWLSEKSPALAADVNSAINGINVTNGTVGTQGSLNDINPYVQTTLYLIYGIAGAITLGAIIFAGVRIGTAGGNPQRRTQGWAALGVACVGAVVIGAAAVFHGMLIHFGSTGQR